MDEDGELSIGGSVNTKTTHWGGASTMWITHFVALRAAQTRLCVCVFKGAFTKNSFHLALFLSAVKREKRPHKRRHLGLCVGFFFFSNSGDG